MDGHSTVFQFKFLDFWLPIRLKSQVLLSNSINGFRIELGLPALLSEVLERIR
jgi:hypothetical protein